jgi:hypothetical protein
LTDVADIIDDVTEVVDDVADIIDDVTDIAGDISDLVKDSLTFMLLLPGQFFFWQCNHSEFPGKRSGANVRIYEGCDKMKP